MARQLVGRAPERTDRPADQDVAPGDVAGLAGDLGGTPVEPGRPVGEAEAFQAMPVGAQREGHDELGAGLEVLPVRAAHELRARRRQLVQAGALGDAAR